MTLDKLFRIALKHFPMAHITEDLDGEIRIHTGLMYEPPLGYSDGPLKDFGCRMNVRLREMNEADLPDAEV